MGHSPDELIELLTAGAAVDGRPTMQAAMHLLTFTPFPHQHDAADLIEFDNDAEPDAPATAAFIRDWRQVEQMGVTRRWGTGAEHLVGLAVSLATGAPVSLRATVPSGGHAHARRLIEAIVIATGHGAHYEITPTAQLEQTIADRAALFGS